MSASTDIIKKAVATGSLVYFQFYADGSLWYEAPAAGICFPVPITDTGTGVFAVQDKAILFMRWIRKYVAFLVEAHGDHGRGDEQDRPEDPDCPCRGTSNRDLCAEAGCGFCNRLVDTLKTNEEHSVPICDTTTLGNNTLGVKS